MSLLWFLVLAAITFALYLGYRIGRWVERVKRTA